MTNKTITNLYGRFLNWPERPVKELPEVTIEDMQNVHEYESELAHDLETERQVDELLVLQENNAI